ncbi:MAG: hypothetical protein ACLUFV_07145 [Acutalibacteraceae bacterium]
MFGPVFGGVARPLPTCSASSSPTGPYNPIFTITAFCGGFIKGWIWRLLAGRNDGRIRRVALCLLLLLGIVGGAFHIALVGDGVTSGLVSEQAELPTRGAIRTEDYNPLTKLVVHLADYNNDVITYSRYTGEADTVTLPSAIVYPDGYTLKVTKLGAKAFPEAVLRVQIPEGVKTIDEKGVRRAGRGQRHRRRGGSAAQKARKGGHRFRRGGGGSADRRGGRGRRISRRRSKTATLSGKYLAGYIISSPWAGVLALLGCSTSARRLHQPAPQKARQEGGAPHIRIFASIFGPAHRDDDQHRRPALLTLPAWAAAPLDSLDAARARRTDHMPHSGVFHRHPVRRVYDALSGSTLTRRRQTNESIVRTGLCRMQLSGRKLLQGLRRNRRPSLRRRLRQRRLLPGHRM